MQSNIFKPSELKTLKEFEKGNRKDKNGIFSRKVRPKIIELIEVWIPKKKHLEKLIKSHRKVKKNAKE